MGDQLASLPTAFTLHVPVFPQLRHGWRPACLVPYGAQRGDTALGALCRLCFHSCCESGPARSLPHWAQTTPCMPSFSRMCCTSRATLARPPCRSERAHLDVTKQQPYHGSLYSTPRPQAPGEQHHPAQWMLVHEQQQPVWNTRPEHRILPLPPVSFLCKHPDLTKRPGISLLASLLQPALTV